MHLPLGKNKEMSSNSISIRKSTLGISRYNFPCKCSSRSKQPMQLHSQRSIGKGGSVSVCVRYIVPHESTC